MSLDVFEKVLKRVAAGVLWLVLPGVVEAAEFFSQRTVIPLAQTCVIPVRLAKPAADEIELKVSVEPKDILEIVRAPVVLPGETIGYVRVRGLKPGQARLRVATDAVITVAVRAERSRVESTLFAPRIVSPAVGAWVWGKFAVGVEFPATARNVSLRLPDGTKILPQKESGPDDGPLRRALFMVEAGELGDGPVRLTAVVENGEVSEPLALHVLAGVPDSLVAGECEAVLDGPRPERFGKKPPNVGSRADASGGAFVMNAASDPAWCLPVTVKEAGSYQVMMVARGDPAAGVLPTVGLVIDNASDPATAVRLCDQNWHRLPVGRPVQLDAGEHTLTLFFMNDFYVPNVADRNLYLDRYEVVRVSRDGPADAALAVAFTRPFHDEPVTGQLTIEGYCSWANPDKNPPPRVTLLVNGEPTLTQQAAAPVFWLDRAFLRAGTNSIQLRATQAGGESASTPALTVHVAGPLPQAPKPRAFHRFTARDDGWDEALRKLLTDRDQPKGHSVALFAANGTATLRLPEELAGNFDLQLEARGEDFKGAPKAAVTLTLGTTTTNVTEIEVSGWWAPRKVSAVTLPKGPKQLSIAFTNDLAEGKKGDRNLWLKSVILQETTETLDRFAPRVTLLYPKPRQTVVGVDAVVAEAFDDVKLAWADVVIDGQPLRLNLASSTGLGRFVFPLVVRSLSNGVHRLSVMVQDLAGNVGESEEITFTVSDQPAREPGRYARAVRLLQRFAFGPDPAELAAVLTLGETAWLEDRLSRPFDTPGERAIMDYGLARYPDDGNSYEVTLRVADHLLLTDNPVRARFVYWVQNHFSTWIRKVEARAEWDEHIRFTRLGVVPFADLLLASATSPAMLAYLDQPRSFANAINENYAREIMELHTLGVQGGYKQADVTALAQLLTGWTLAEEADRSGRGNPLAKEFRFDPRLSDGHPQRVLGVTFAACPPAQRYDRVRSALELLAAHPSTAKFICRKLADHYVAPHAPVALVNDLSRVFLETGGDMKAVLHALAAHPEFWRTDLPARVNTPLDYCVSLNRVCGNANPWGVNDFLQRSGMGTFDRSQPDGYPEQDESYANSNAMMQRWHLAQQERWALNRLVPDWWREPGALDPHQWRQNVVDVVAARLTGRLLSPASNQAALDVFAAAKGKSWEQTLQLATFIAQLPEANLK